MHGENYKWHFDYSRLANDTGFAFQKHKIQNLDKSKMCLIDVDRVIRERDVDTIEQCIPIVVRFVLDPEQTEVLDGSFVRTFRISQLSVEYLMFCKQYLDNTVVLLKEELKKAKQENDELKEFVDQLKTHVSELTDKIQEQATFKCDECAKVFSTEEFLVAHKKRRHAIVDSSNVNLELLEADKLHLEIKELKGRLNSAEKLMQNSSSEAMAGNNELKMLELQQKFENLKTQVEAELKNLHYQFNLEEKCGQWFGLALQNINRPEEPPPENKMDKARGFVMKDFTTQTEGRGDETVEKMMGKPDKDTENLKESNLKSEEALYMAQKQMSELGDVLETKVTSSLQKIEERMQSFWIKLNEIEETTSAKVSNQQENHHRHVKGSSSPPPVKPRSKYTLGEDTDRKSMYHLPPSPLSKQKPRIDEQTEHRSLATNHKSSSSEEEEEAPVRELPRPRSSKMIKQQQPKVVAIEEEEEEIPVKQEAKKSKIKAVKTASRFNQQLLSSEPELSSSEESLSIKSTNANFLVNKELVLTKFQKEVEAVIVSRLQALGVSADWKGLPFHTFQSAMAIVKHQAELLKKTHPTFDAVSKQIEKKVSAQIPRMTKIKQKNVARKQPSLNRPSVNEAPPPAKSRVDIRNRRMYATDSESEAIQTPVKRNNFSNKYSAVIQELRTVTKAQASDSDDSLKGERLNKTATPTKGVLRNPLLVPSAKKKVLFNLRSEEEKGGGDYRLREGGGSTTSVASSVLDEKGVDESPDKERKKTNAKEEKNVMEKDIEDLSDFDFSEL